MLKFENVPYRRWGMGGYNKRLVDAKEGQRVMDLMGKVMKEGKAVDFSMSQPLCVNPTPGEVYDTISLKVLD